MGLLDQIIKANQIGRGEIDPRLAEAWKTMRGGMGGGLLQQPQAQEGGLLQQAPPAAMPNQQGAPSGSPMPQGQQVPPVLPEKGIIPQKALSPMDRWKQQIDAMMSSGNSALQEKGLGMMQAFHQRATETPTVAATRRSPGHYAAIDAGHKEGTAPYYKAVEAHNAKSTGSNITVNAGQKTDESERKAEFAREKMLSASKRLDEMEAAGDHFDPESWDFAMDELFDYVPVFGNFFVTDAGQKRKAYEKDWLLTFARDQSGAEIKISEMDEYRDIYFAKMGNKPQAVAAKARLRREAQELMKVRSNRALGNKGEIDEGKGIFKAYFKNQGQASSVMTHPEYGAEVRRTPLPSGETIITFTNGKSLVYKPEELTNAK